MALTQYYHWALVALFRDDELVKEHYTDLLHKDDLYVFGLLIDDKLTGTFRFNSDNQLQFKPITDIIIGGEVMKPIPLSVAICSKILQPNHPYVTKYIIKRKSVSSEVEAIHELYGLYIYTLLYLNLKLLES